MSALSEQHPAFQLCEGVFWSLLASVNVTIESHSMTIIEADGISMLIFILGIKVTSSQVLPINPTL